MHDTPPPLGSGLYLVATPIGNARDITLRALDVLGAADILVAEDTRVLRKLLGLHGIALGGRSLIAYHDHSAPAARDGILALVLEGKSVCYCSDAGSPLIADPGFALVRAAVEQNVAVTVVPGPSSVVAGLSLAGLPTDRFLFAGFAPKPGAARMTFLKELDSVPATLVLLETAKRVHGLLVDLCETMSGDREAALCRELTKKFEEVRRGTLETLRDGLLDSPVKGEIVLVLGPAVANSATDDDIQSALIAALGRLSMRDAVDEVTAGYKLNRRKVYQMALALQKGT